MSSKWQRRALFLVEPGWDPNGIRPQSGSRFGTLQAMRAPAAARMRKTFFHFLAAALLLALFSGCDRLSRHKVITFFFTGVPSLEEQDRQQEAALEEAKNPKLATAGAKTASSSPQKKRSVAVKATRYAHGPYAANECYQCHEVSASGGFRGFGKQEAAADSLAKAGIVPGKMIAPPAELCVGCHASKKPERAYQAGLWVHGPVSAGYCTVCHTPHASPEQYLLLAKPDELCVECHAQTLIFNKAMHQDRTDCSACHNPHVGRDSRLLKAELQESW